MGSQDHSASLLFLRSGYLGLVPIWVSPLGLVPKKEPGKFRLIHYFSYSEGLSINDGIPEDKSHISYQLIDDAVSHT